MRAKHKNPIGPSAKPIPKVISFQDPLPERVVCPLSANSRHPGIRGRHRFVLG